jgi:hypothetical protein
VGEIKMNKLDVLLIGDARRREFDAAVRWIRRNSRLTREGSVASAVAQIPSAALDLIVLVSARPGQFADADADRLRQRWPQARLLALLGSWCEGETRSGRPLRHVPRLYAHQWASRLAKEGAHGWLLPPADAASEHWPTLAETAHSDRRALAVVYSTSASYAEGLADAVADAGYAAACLDVRTLGHLRGASVIIYDASPHPTTRVDEIATLRRRHAEAPLIALVSSPRIHEIAQLRVAGAAAVVSQPFLLGELIGQIDELIAQWADRLHATLSSS